MKVGRREFLKLLGATAGTATIPKKIEGVEQAPVVAEKAYRPQWYTPSWLVDATHEVVEDLHQAEFRAVDQIINTGYVDVHEGTPCGPLSLGEYAKQMGIEADWIFATNERCDCPACRAALREYDCDFYFPISEGVCFESWTDPWNGDERHVQLEWLDHGLHTVYLADGQYLGQSLSKGVDPFEHVRSIWAAGQVAMKAVFARGVGGGIINLG